MSQYNIVRNSSFISNTSSGTGDVSLTWAQLESLIDGVTTSGGVTVSGSDILCLDVDLSQRIKVDGVHLYASDMGKSSNVKFYYRNATTGDYISLSTVSGSTYYSTTVPDPSAPQCVRVTVSGVNITLYEFEIFNDA